MGCRGICSGSWSFMGWIFDLTTGKRAQYGQVEHSGVKMVPPG